MSSLLQESDSVYGEFEELNQLLAKKAIPLKEAVLQCKHQASGPETRKGAATPKFPELQNTQLRSDYVELRVTKMRVILRNVTPTSFPSIIAKVFEMEFSSVIRPLVNTTVDDIQWSVQRSFLYSLGLSSPHFQYSAVTALLEDFTGAQRDIALFTILDLQCWGLLGDIPACYDYLQTSLSRVEPKWSKNRDIWLKFYPKELIFSKLPGNLFQLCVLECDEVIPQANTVNNVLSLYSMYPFVVTCCIISWLLKSPHKMESELEGIHKVLQDACQIYPGLYLRIINAIPVLHNRLEGAIPPTPIDLEWSLIEAHITAYAIDINSSQDIFASLIARSDKDKNSLPLKYIAKAIESDESQTIPKELQQAATQILSTSTDALLVIDKLETGLKKVCWKRIVFFTF
jgi:hypothetical protein